MTRVLLAALALSGCASVRPEAFYYTPERCFGLRDSERKASTIEAGAGRGAAGFAAGGVLSEALKASGIDTGPATLIAAGASLALGIVWEGARASGKSSRAEWEEECQSMPIPAVETVATN